MLPKNNYIFNFSASYSGGGYKRFAAFSKEFSSLGGAVFIANQRCRAIADQFSNNKYFFVDEPWRKRLVGDCSYLPDILKSYNKPDLYYSYGIPIYSRVASVNWFHLSNVLPLAPTGIPISTLDTFKMLCLGWKIKSNFANADIISAESIASLRFINKNHHKKFFVSLNGADDELELATYLGKSSRENIAVVIGTYLYKAIDDSFRLFEMIKLTHCPDLKLIIIGAKNTIPRNIQLNPNVILTGSLSRPEVIAWLKKARYYISTTYIENSFNAASEGIFIAEESYISDIAPHRELLLDMPFETISVSGINRTILHVKKDELNTSNLKSWSTVVSEIAIKTNEALKSHN